MSSTNLLMQHTSLQFSDSRAQQKSDVEKLFRLGLRFPIKTGTESSTTTDLNEFLKEAAKDYNHVIHFARGNWVAIDRAIIKPNTIKKNAVFVISNDHLVGKMHDRAFPTVAFTHKDARVGRIAVAAVHYATKGARPGQPNYKANLLYSSKLEKWMTDAARGTALSFAAGDFNTNDRELDFTHGKNFTSMADELDRHQNTGHGPIDGFVSYDRDGRVKAKRFEVLDDSEMKMHSDHFVCRGTWTVEHLKGK